MSLVDASSIGAGAADCAVCEIDTYYRLVRPDGGHVPLCSPECERAWPRVERMVAAIDAIAALPADHVAKMPWESIKVLAAAINTARSGSAQLDAHLVMANPKGQPR